MNVNFNYGDVENEDRHIAETEAEDFANEQAETLHAKLIMGGDNFEAVDISSVVSGLFSEDRLEDRFEDRLEDDSVGKLGDEIPSNEMMFPLPENYNAPENYGS